jgi:hypothetical protein
MTVFMCTAAWAEPQSPEELEKLDALKSSAINFFNRKEYDKFLI